MLMPQSSWDFCYCIRFNGSLRTASILSCHVAATPTCPVSHGARQSFLAAHHGTIAALTRDLNHAAEARSLAFGARDAAQEAQRTLSRYATKAQQEKAAELLAKREAECDKAAKTHGSIQQDINYKMLVDLKPLMEKLTELMNEEARLAHYITGASYTNELGIVVPPRPPI